MGYAFMIVFIGLDLHLLMVSILYTSHIGMGEVITHVRCKEYNLLLTIYNYSSASEISSIS